MDKIRYGVELSALWPPADRCVSAYCEPMEIDEMIEKLGQVQGVDGTELYWPGDFNDDPVKMKEKLDNAGLGVSAIGVDVFTDAKWKFGALTSADANLRQEAINRHKEALDAAVTMGVEILTCWPGQEGFDYPFQVDYPVLWQRLVDAIREIGEHNPGIMVACEYKVKEPRSHLFISDAGKTLVLCNDVNLPNVGVCIDVGHSLIAFENPGEAISFLDSHDKLFHIHVNDNYREWDYDMLPGSVHLWETLESFYWIDKIGYEGWINFDICPFREDAIRASQETVNMARQLMQLARSLDHEQLAALQAESDSVGVCKLLRESVLKG